MGSSVNIQLVNTTDYCDIAAVQGFGCREQIEDTSDMLQRCHCQGTVMSLHTCSRCQEYAARAVVFLRCLHGCRGVGGLASRRLLPAERAGPAARGLVAGPCSAGHRAGPPCCPPPGLPRHLRPSRQGFSPSWASVCLQISVKTCCDAQQYALMLSVGSAEAFWESRACVCGFKAIAA